MLPGVLLVSRNLECALLPVIFVGLLGSTSLQGTNLDWSEKSTDTKVLRFTKYSSKAQQVPWQDSKGMHCLPCLPQPAVTWH